MGAAHGEALLALADGPHADRLQLGADGCIAALSQLLRACTYADAAPLALSAPLQQLVDGLLESRAVHEVRLEQTRAQHAAARGLHPGPTR